MPYSDTPQANFTIASTTTPIRNNFQFIQSTLQTDHCFNGNIVGVAEGVHGKVSFANQPTPPALPAGAAAELYMNSGNLVLRNSGGNTYRLTEFSGAQNGYQWLGLILMQWGFVNVAIVNGSSGTVNFPIPFSSVCLNVSATPYYSNNNFPGGAAGVTVRSDGTFPTTSAFQWRAYTNASNYTGFYWMALGR